MKVVKKCLCLWKCPFGWDHNCQNPDIKCPVHNPRPVGRPRKTLCPIPCDGSCVKFPGAKMVSYESTLTVFKPIDPESSSVAIANKVNELISFLEGKYK